MKQAFRAPQYGFAAAGRFAEDIKDSPQIQPATTSAFAYSGSSTFRPTTGPTVVVKAIKRRRLDVGAAANGAEVKTQSSGTPSTAGDADGTRSPKVFRLAPPWTASPPENVQQAEPSVSDKKVGADPFEPASAAPTPPPATPRHRRRRNPVTAPVLVRHVVFERNEADGREQPEVQMEDPAHSQADYRSVTRALHQLREKVDTLVKVNKLLAELGDLTRVRAIRDPSGAP